jgi:hypothetical protein
MCGGEIECVYERECVREVECVCVFLREQSVCACLNAC